MPPVTLTKKHLATDAGKDLLAILLDITRDGNVDVAEAHRLRSWLTSHQEAMSIPAVAWLAELLEAVLADGVITKFERYDLLQGFDRVLPPDERLLSKVRRREAGTDARPVPATDRQVAYLRALGATISDDITKVEASAMLDDLIADGRDVSKRQLMVLRFWNRCDVAALGREGVSDWMDEWYARNPAHKAAWSLWKAENGDDGLQGDPTRVPIGAGKDYLPRAEAQMQIQSSYRSGPANPNSTSLIDTFALWALGKLIKVAVIIAIGIWLLRRLYDTK